MKKVPHSYVNIQDWMYDIPGLRLPEIVAYAVIFGFSMDDESDFHAGHAYLCRKLAATKPTVEKALQTLIERGLIIKGAPRLINGVEFCTYTAVIPESVNAPALQQPAPAAKPAHEKKSAAPATKPAPWGPALSEYAPEFKEDIAVRMALSILAGEPKWKGKTANAWKLAVQKLSRFANGDSCRAVAIIERTIERGWTGLFDIDDRDMAEWRREKSPNSGYRPADGTSPRPASVRPVKSGVNASEELVDAAMGVFNQ